MPSHAARPAPSTDAPEIQAIGARRPGLTARFGQQRVCAVVVAAVMVGATAVSTLPVTPQPDSGAGAQAVLTAAAIGGPAGDAAAPRLSVGGDFGIRRRGIVEGDPTAPPPNAVRNLTPVALPETSAQDTATVSGPFLDDGTLLKPVSVETTVADGKSLLRTYTVKRGDTLDTLGRKFKVSPSTIYWANDLKNTRLVKGWKLTIPPVTGLVVTVKATDTLESLAKAHKIKADAILAANELDDPNLVMGQVLVLPGARGPEMVQAPKPKKVVIRSSGSGGSGAVASGGPSRYTGGRFVWPVAGGGDVSRGFAGGHYGLDIAADSGTAVRASASGKVIFAGWKSNGGGYQVWISHGSGLYSTYNHMSSLNVGTGQSVGRGQRLGGVGSTGYATGPHLHFEVWRGPIWNGGSRVNPMAYL